MGKHMKIMGKSLLFAITGYREPRIYSHMSNQGDFSQKSKKHIISQINIDTLHVCHVGRHFSLEWKTCENYDQIAIFTRLQLYVCHVGRHFNRE